MKRLLDRATPVIVFGVFVAFFVGMFLWRFVISPLPQEEIDRRHGKPFIIEVEGVKAMCHYEMDTLVSWHTDCVPVP